MALTVEIPPEGHDVTHPVQDPTRSEGWRCAITADTPRTTLERSVGLLDGDDEDFSAGLEICWVPPLEKDEGCFGRHQYFLFANFFFQRQHPAVDGGADLLDIRVRHRALRPGVPRVVSFSRSTHSRGKECHFA